MPTPWLRLSSCVGCWGHGIWPCSLVLFGSLVHLLDVMEVYLRATPTAAGPSSGKRSVLWRTRGFGTLGFERFVGGVGGDLGGIWGPVN